MKRILGILICCVIAFNNLLQAQCSSVTVEAYQVSVGNYGVRATLAYPYNQDVGINGSITEPGGPTDVYSITVPAGSLTGESNNTWQMSSSPDITISNVIPCPDQFNYDAFDNWFNNIGAFHNQSLSNLINTFQASQSINTYEAAVNNLRDLNKSFYNSNESSYFGSTLPSQFTNEEFEKSKYYVNRIDFENKLLSSNSSISLDSCIIKINSMSTIDNSNKQLFQNIANLIRSSLNREISNSEFEASLVNLSMNWLQINSNNIQAFGARLTGYVLTIGLKSCEWWGQNMSELDDGNDNTIAIMEASNLNPLIKRSGPKPDSDKLNTLYVLPAIVANDIAGAFVGTILNTVQQWHDKGISNINMDHVYRAAAIGAVTGSVGLVGRVGRWLRSLF